MTTTMMKVKSKVTLSRQELFTSRTSNQYRNRKMRECQYSLRLHLYHTFLIIYLPDHLNRPPTDPSLSSHLFTSLQNLHNIISHGQRRVSLSDSCGQKDDQKSEFLTHPLCCPPSLSPPCLGSQSHRLRRGDCPNHDGYQRSCYCYWRRCSCS